MWPTGARAGKLEYAEMCEVHRTGLSINQLPNETLNTILGLYIHEYFQDYRHLSARLPAPLHVCHKWRQLAISTPTCWTNLKIHINTQSKMEYACRNISKRDTKSKAMQDNLNCYFIWAKDCPVDLSINFSQHFDKEIKNTLAHWISSNLPKLRSYREVGDAGLFLRILPKVSADRFGELTDLHIAKPAYGFKIVHSVSMPKLRVLRLHSRSEYHSFINHLDAPNLRALEMAANDRWLQDVAALEHFPLLAELAIHVYTSFGPFNSAVPHPEFNHLRRIIVIGRCPRMTLFISICRTLFPKVRDWTIDSPFARALHEFRFTEDLALGSVETLSILCPPYLHLSDSRTELGKLDELWHYFPNIVHLTLETFMFRQGLRFVSENDTQVNTRSDNMDVAMGGLIKSLGWKSKDSLSPRHCPKLKTIEILNSELPLNAADSLLNVLRLRSSNALDTTEVGDEDIGCRLTIKWSKFFYYKTYYNKDLTPVEVSNASYSEFKSLVDKSRATLVPVHEISEEA